VGRAAADRPDLARICVIIRTYFETRSGFGAIDNMYGRMNLVAWQNRND
jgi:hypothetical protein